MDKNIKYQIHVCRCH